MSAVAELDHQSNEAPTAASPGEPPEPSEEQLLDVLYEVLATGPAPKSKLTRERVEQLLHEHARKAKPISEMVAFFKEHDLPLRSEEYGSDAELRELASGLQRERSSLVPGLLLAEPEEPATLPPATVEAIRRETEVPAEDAESTGKHAAVLVAAPAKRLHWGVWAAAALLLLALGGGLAYGYLRSSQLENRLEQARMQQKSTDVALTKLEQRAETLQGELKQTESERRAQQARFEDELAAQTKKRATEELAVEKMLGVRYTKLRQKLANEAAQPAK
ncbi:MAG TPA: hypothetical protein VFX59_15260 [Polyangiales bacterium]|nr:hypothetical protein [Polyangiales bacterium]